MAANKVAINGKTILDLTQDTVTADKMVSGVTAHDKSGKQITGTKKYGSGFRVTGAYASARTTVDGTTYNGEQTADMGDFYIDSASKFTPQVYIPKSKFSTVFGDATIADVLAGASFTGADGTKKVGAMPNNGAASIQLSDLTAKSVTAGYYSGGTAKIADAEAAKIIPENIKNGVTILGVEGTMEASAGGDYNIAATTNSDGTQNLAITDAAGGGSSGGGSGRAPVNLTVTVDPTNAPDDWALDVYGPNGNFVTFDSNNLTASIPDCTAGDVFIVSTSQDPSTGDSSSSSGKGYIDSSTVCVNCVFDLSGFATDYTASHAQYCVYGCQIDSDLSAGSEATMTLKFF